MDKKFNLFKASKPYTYAKKKDYLDIQLTTGSVQNINGATGNLDFEVGGTDMYLDLCESEITGNIKVTVATNKNITLENNFFPAMFSQMVLRINGNSFQTVNYPNIIDSIMKYITLPKDYADMEGCITGWFPDTHSGGIVNQLPDDATVAQIVAQLNLEKVNTGFQYRKKYFTPKAGENKFTIKYPLKLLFSILDHKAYSTQVRWSLRLTKNISIGQLFFGATGSTNNDVTLVVEQIFLRIPQVTPSIHIEPQLLKQISSDKPAQASVMDRKINSITIGMEVWYEWEISKLMNNPRYVFVVFKDTANTESILHNNSKFINHKDADNYIKSLQLVVDNVRYPIEPIVINDGASRNIYPAFDRFEQIAHKFGNITPLDIHDFDNLASIFCFDLSASEELLKKNGINVKLIIEKKGFPCQAFAMYLEDNTYSIDYKKGLITSEIA